MKEQIPMYSKEQAENEASRMQKLVEQDEATDYSSAEIMVEIEKIKNLVGTNSERVAKLGEWPEYIKPGSLLERIPSNESEKAPGFDAGIACATNIIPLEMQKLSAKLHANYSKEAVLQILDELKQRDSNSETIWWLSACYFCNEDGVDQKTFLKQINSFEDAASNSEKRLDTAMSMYKKMSSSFELRDDVPYSEKNGGIQGAYIAGYTYGVEYSDKYGLYFIGTYEPSLGLENFKWSDEKDEKGRQKSGPVFGSKQFVKCSSEEELNNALKIIKENLPLRQEKD